MENIFTYTCYYLLGFSRHLEVSSQLILINNIWIIHFLNYKHITLITSVMVNTEDDYLNENVYSVECYTFLFDQNILKLYNLYEKCFKKFVVNHVTQNNIERNVRIFALWLKINPVIFLNQNIMALEKMNIKNRLIKWNDLFSNNPLDLINKHTVRSATIFDICEWFRQHFKPMNKLISFSFAEILENDINDTYDSVQLAINCDGNAFSLNKIDHYFLLLLNSIKKSRGNITIEANHEEKQTSSVIPSNNAIHYNPIVRHLLNNRFKIYKKEHLSDRWSRALLHTNNSSYFLPTNRIENQSQSTKNFTNSSINNNTIASVLLNTTLEMANVNNESVDVVNTDDDKIQARVYDPLMPYPEEYPEEYQTIQNGPALIISRTSYTRIPNVTYTTITTVTLPTYKLLEKAENGFMNTLFDQRRRRFRRQQLK